MPYCPQCLTEYREGVERCAECGVGLLPGIPPAPVPHGKVKFARVRTFTGPTAGLDATLARNVLESEGIPCALPGEVSAEVLPGVDVVQLLVREQDAERAAEILTDYFDRSAPLAEDEPPPAT